MKKPMALFALIALSALFAGCPYESMVPIDAPQTKTDPQLLGRWTDEKDKVTYHVSRKDDFTYQISRVENDGRDEKYEAHPTVVNGSTFLNLRQMKDDQGQTKYLLYKMEIRENILTLSPVTEYIREKFNTSQELRSFVAANMHNSYFFEEAGILKRMD